jgi:hypothetical protein
MSRSCFAASRIISEYPNDVELSVVHLALQRH